MSTSLSEQDPPIKANKNATDEIIVNGSMRRAIWEMSWPLYINFMTIAVATCGEIWVAGKLGSTAQAAIGLGGQIWFFMVLLVVALSVGTNALVSRFWGAGDRQNAIFAARQSLIFSVFFGFSVMAIGLLVCRPLYRLLGASPEVEELGWQFMSIDLLGQPLITIHWVSNAIFRARGDTRTPMITAGLVCLLVVMLNYGLCIAPFQWGVAGLGMAWPIASVFGVALSLYLQRKSDLGACLDWKGPGLSREWFWRLMKIGIPACVQDLAWVGGNFVLLWILAHAKNPTACEASWAIGLRVEETLGGMPIYALSSAVATLVGQNLGAKKPERAEKAGWLVTAIGAIYNVVIAVILFIAAEPIARLMSKDAAVIAYTTQYFQVVGLAQPFVAVWLILLGAMQGAGYTKWPMIASVVFLVILRLPLAWYLSITLGAGPMGTWVALAASAVLVAIAMCWRFWTGVWKTQEV